jgi:hypothetical protein
MTTNSKIRWRTGWADIGWAGIGWPEALAASSATAVISAAIVMVTALVAGTAIAANAAAHSGEPSALAERNVPAMASPALAIQQMSTVVTGVLAAAEAGAPPAGQWLHFQGRISGNLYMVRTESNGGFSTMLPAGLYDLRDMHGTVIASGVTVGQSPVDLGQVRPPGPYNVWWLVEQQKIGEAIVESPAPATAYIPNAGQGPQPIAVTPVVSPKVMGAGPNGRALAPAEVMPEQILKQTEIPSGALAPPPGMPPDQDMAPAPVPGNDY